MVRLLLVRHGQSEWNALGRWQGQADPPLTELGRRQAEAAVSAVAEMVTHVIAASDLERAHRTASIITESLGLDAPIVDARLRERRAGAWSGLTKAEIELRWPGWLESGQRPDGYESGDELWARVRPALEALAERIGQGGTGMVIAHAGIIYTTEDRAGVPFERIGNLSGRWVTVRDQRFVLGDRTDLIDVERVEATVPDQI